MSNVNDKLSRFNGKYRRYVVDVGWAMRSFIDKTSQVVNYTKGAIITNTTRISASNLYYSAMKQIFEIVSNDTAQSVIRAKMEFPLWVDRVLREGRIIAIPNYMQLLEEAYIELLMNVIAIIDSIINTDRVNSDYLLETVEYDYVIVVKVIYGETHGF